MVITIVIIVVAAIIIISIIVVGVCLCKKDKQISNNKNNNNKEINEKNNVQFHRMEKIPTRRKSKKNKTTMPKLETENVITIEETGVNTNTILDENGKERKKSRSKTKRHTIKSRKHKKHKTSKFNKDTEE